MDSEHFAAVRPTPEELGGLERAIGTSPHRGVLQTESAQDRRHMGDLSKWIRDVGDVHRLAKQVGDAVTSQEVAHERLASRQELVRDDVPRSDEQLPLL